MRFPRVRRFLERAFDVVLLQEHWRIPGRPRALDDLGLIAHGERRGDAGLAIFTRHRVLEMSHASFRAGAAHWLERRFSRKGWQRVALEIGGERVDVINTHLEAHAAPKHARVRAAQIDELLAVAAGLGGAVVLAGDFNLYEDVGSDQASVAAIHQAGFTDAAAPFDRNPTYDRSGERERFDRVFVRGLECTAAHVDRQARLADHRPLIVELAPRGAGAARRTA